MSNFQHLSFYYLTKMLLSNLSWKKIENLIHFGNFTSALNTKITKILKVKV